MGLLCYWYTDIVSMDISDASRKEVSIISYGTNATYVPQLQASANIESIPSAAGHIPSVGPASVNRIEAAASEACHNSTAHPASVQGIAASAAGQSPSAGPASVNVMEAAASEAGHNSMVHPASVQDIAASGNADHGIMRSPDAADRCAAASAEPAAASPRSCFRPLGPWSRVAAFASTQPASRRSSTSRSKHRTRVGTSGLNVKPRISQKMTLSWSWCSHASLSRVGPTTVRSVVRASNFAGTTGILRRSSAIMNSSLGGRRPRTRISPMKRWFPNAAFLRRASASGSSSSAPWSAANGNQDASYS
mmetsp:Transcript_65689/g.192196  ORF Transcript_65689/g.192196 Transcript_65689/m.192196 type:complete len:307 (-) Transcript_65689:883-1803(-)